MAQDDINTAAMDIIRNVPDDRLCTYPQLGCSDGRVLETLARGGDHVRMTNFGLMYEIEISKRKHLQPIASRINTSNDQNQPVLSIDEQVDFVNKVTHSTSLQHRQHSDRPLRSENITHN